MIKKIKNKYLIFLAFLFTFIFLSSSFAHALEITYPTIPGYLTPSATCTGTDCLAIYISYLFGILIYIAGFLALISFAIGAVGLINPSVEAHNQAKDRMRGAVLGLVLTAASFIIIRTINPMLITPSLSPLPGVQGVFYSDGVQKKPAPIAEGDVAGVIAKLNKDTGLNFSSLIYDCTGNGEADTGPALLIWEFPQSNFQGNNPNDYSGITVKRKKCGETEDISSVGSFKMAFETPGVYYCLGGAGGGCGSDNMCSGYMSNVVASDEAEISTPFKGNISGVRIVNDQSTGENYGVIFHKEDLVDGGKCTLPIISKDDGAKCLPVDPPDFTSAAQVFNWNANPETSGNGVSFYSTSFGDADVGNAGFMNIPADQIKIDYVPDNPLIATKMCFDYSKSYKPDEYKCKCQKPCINPDTGQNQCTGKENCDNNLNICVGKDEAPPTCQDGPNYAYCNNEAKTCSDVACEDFADNTAGNNCSGSIKVNGDYLVALYSKNADQTLYCQTFDGDVPDLGSQAFLSDTKKLESVYIIPVQ